MTEVEVRGAGRAIRPAIASAGRRLGRGGVRPPDPDRHGDRRGTAAEGRRGFTLIELLIVVVVIGILAAIAVPRYLTVRRLAYYATVKSDLRMLSVQQELYHKEHDEYAATLDLLPDWSSSPGVEVTLGGVDAMGWSATATHPALQGEQCGIFFGTAAAADAPPAVSPGIPACTE